MTHHTNSNSPAQSNSGNRLFWASARVSSDGGVIGVFINENASTFELCWVNDDPEDPAPARFSIEDMSLVFELIKDAQRQLNDEGATDV